MKLARKKQKNIEKKSKLINYDNRYGEKENWDEKNKNSWIRNKL